MKGEIMKTFRPSWSRPMNRRRLSWLSLPHIAPSFFASLSDYKDESGQALRWVVRSSHHLVVGVVSITPARLLERDGLASFLQFAFVHGGVTSFLAVGLIDVEDDITLLELFEVLRFHWHCGTVCDKMHKSWANACQRGCRVPRTYAAILSSTSAREHNDETRGDGEAHVASPHCSQRSAWDISARSGIYQRFTSEGGTKTAQNRNQTVTHQSPEYKQHSRVSSLCKREISLGNPRLVCFSAERDLRIVNTCLASNSSSLLELR